MKLLVDMNLTPEWVGFLTSRGSVVQVRTQDPTPEVIGELLVKLLRQQVAQLERGVLITVKPHRMRVRVLPLWQGG